MIGCQLPFIEVQSLIDHCIAGATLQQHEAYLTTMPPCWANARGGHAFQLRVGTDDYATSPL